MGRREWRRGGGRVGKEEERIRRGREEGDLKGKTGTGKRGIGGMGKNGQEEGRSPPSTHFYKLASSRRSVSDSA